jgi:hypothetical protein
MPDPHVGTQHPRALHGLDCGAGARWCAPPGHSSLPTMTGRPADVCAVVHRTGGIGGLCDLGHRALPQPYIVSHSWIRSEEGPKMKFSPDRVADPAAIHSCRGTPVVVRHLPDDHRARGGAVVADQRRGIPHLEPVPRYGDCRSHSFRAHGRSRKSTDWAAAETLGSLPKHLNLLSQRAGVL